MNNLFAACRSCNNEKSDMTSGEYRKFKENKSGSKVKWYDELMRR